jgi:hypothetical protein
MFDIRKAGGTRPFFEKVATIESRTAARGAGREPWGAKPKRLLPAARDGSRIDMGHCALN